MYFSLIIPVYNRPDEIDELLLSLTTQSYKKGFEVVIVEDGSVNRCENVIEKYASRLSVSYYFKSNTGPGDSRNFGMRKAKGDYFLILDSDCILPENYLENVSQNLKISFVHCFGGVDTAMETFSPIQKAINFAMTSFITTGGVRGGNEITGKFQPRSFNMGISKEAFEKSDGFGNIHPGEDPDLSIRLWNLGYQTKLFKDVSVFHKRRIDWNKFYVQVNKFGKARPILDSWYPEHAKITFWFPSLFLIGFISSIILLLMGTPYFLLVYLIYYFLVGFLSLIQNKNIIIAFYSIIATSIQFIGYGTGYLESYFKIQILKQKPQNAFPKLFFIK